MSAYTKMKAQHRKDVKTRLDELLSQCTLRQQEVFRCMYPKGPSQKQMEWAFQQVERTISKNPEK